MGHNVIFNFRIQISQNLETLRSHSETQKSAASFAATVSTAGT